MNEDLVIEVSIPFGSVVLKVEVVEPCSLRITVRPPPDENPPAP